MRECSLIPYLCKHPTWDIGSLESWIDANISFKQTRNPNSQPNLK